MVEHLCSLYVRFKNIIFPIIFPMFITTFLKWFLFCPKLSFYLDKHYDIMKHMRRIILDRADILTIILALMIGLSIGFFIPTKCSIAIRLFIHNIYLKINPDAQKDSKTLILEKVSKNNDILEQKTIFDKPDKNQETPVMFIKKIFKNNNTDEKKKQTINDFILN